MTVLITKISKKQSSLSTAFKQKQTTTGMFNALKETCLRL